MTSVAISPIFAHFQNLDLAVQQHPQKSQDLHEVYVVNLNKCYEASVLESRMYQALKIIATIAFVIIVGGAAAATAVASLASIPISVIVSALLTDLFYRHIYAPLNNREENCKTVTSVYKILIQTAHQLSLKSDDELESEVRFIVKDHFDDALSKAAFLCPDHPIRGFILPLANYHIRLNQVDALEKRHKQIINDFKRPLQQLTRQTTDFGDKIKLLGSINMMSSLEALSTSNALIQAKLDAIETAMIIIDPTRKKRNFFFSPLNASTHVRLHDMKNPNDFIIGFRKDSDDKFQPITRSDILDYSVEEIIEWLMDEPLALSDDSDRSSDVVRRELTLSPDSLED